LTLACATVMASGQAAARNISCELDSEADLGFDAMSVVARRFQDRSPASLGGYMER